ncbi:MAG: hypothetical protein JXA52_09660 [Planctomycetes bacterium]|nr:hypothetical protein [Planctomycetota bacterium]
MDTEVLKDPPPRFMQKLVRNRKLWLLVTLVAGYFLLLFVLSRLIDARALRRELEETTASIIGADVTIGLVETEIRPLGGWRVRLRDIVIENASPDFEGNLFTCRKVVVEGSITDLLAGKWKPDILFKNWAVQIHLLPDGTSNLSDLFLPQGSAPKAYQTWPFSEIMMAGQQFKLENGKLFLVNDIGGEQLHETGLLEGEGSYAPGKDPDSISGELQFTLGGPTTGKETDGKRLDASFAVREFVATEGAFEGKWRLGLEGKGVPLEVIARLLRLPHTPTAGELADGKANVEGLFGKNHPAWLKNADILINLQENSLPLFGMDGPLQIAYQRGDKLVTAGDDGIENTLQRHELVFTEAKGETPKTAAVICLAGKDGKVVEMGIKASDFNFSRIPKQSDHEPWSETFLPQLRKVTAGVTSFRMLGFTVKDARTITEIENNAIAKMAMAGGFCNGKIAFGTGGWPLGDTGWPKAIGVTVRDAEATSFIETISHMLPAPAVLSPTEGRIYCTLFHIPEATDPGLVLQEELLHKLDMDLVAPEEMGATKGWDGTLLLKDVRFDEHGDNPILKALWEIPAQLAELQDICLPAQAQPKNGKTRGLTSLRVKEGSLRAVREDTGGMLQLEGGFITRELGRVMLKGGPLSGTEGYRLTLQAYPFEGMEGEQDSIALPELHLGVLSAAKAVEAKNGLLLTFDISDQEVTLTESYLDEVKQAYENLNQAQPDSSPANP